MLLHIRKKEGLRQRAKVALDVGIPLFVSEWGSIQVNGDGEVDEESEEQWTQFMKEFGLSQCNWSVCDKEEGVSIFQPEAGLKKNYDGYLSESGKLVRKLIEEWED